MARWLRRALVALAALVGILVLAIAGVGVYASRLLSKRWDVPAPTVRAATDPVRVARGERIFRSSCFLCHSDANGRVSGKHMDDVPTWLGTFHTANITTDAATGVGGWSDAELARAIRFGVRRDGRAIFIMPQFKQLSDEDLSAVMGFMRSGDPMFAPVQVRRPGLAPSFAGKVILSTVMGFDPSGPVEGVTAPPPGPTAAYGKYLTDAVVDCAGCHTAGFAPDKVRGERAWAGGFEFAGADGLPIRSPNLTPDEETGIGRWSRDQFARAVRDGVRPDGTTLHPPMPVFRALTDDDLTAIYAHLRTLPPVRNAVPRAPSAPAPAGPQVALASATADDPATLFAKHGCVACHGEGMPFRAKLRSALSHDVDEVAARILRPQDFSKSAMMPSFAGRLDEATAKKLARWVKEQAKAIPEPAAEPAALPAAR